MTASKTYHAMIAGSRFEFKNGRSVFFVGEKSGTGAYTTDDPIEQSELDTVCKTHGSSMSAVGVPTMAQASQPIAAESNANTAAAVKAAAVVK